MTITYEMSLENAQIEQTDFTNTATLTPEIIQRSKRKQLSKVADKHLLKLI